MQLFEIKWTFPNNPIIDGLHKWGLPGIECSECGDTGGTIGCEYPNVNLPVLVDPKPYLKGWPVSPERLEELRQPIRPLLARHLPLFPGTQFGTIVGKARAKVGDFAWQKTMTPLIREGAYHKLRERGIQIMGVPAELKYRGKQPQKLLVLQVEPRARWDESCLVDERYCSTCGSYLGMVKKPLTVKGSSVPKDADLFRVIWHTMRVISTERFKEVVTEMQLTDIAFEEIPVSDR